VCVTEIEERIFEQRCAIKFCVKHGETGIETSNKLKQAYGEHALSRSQVFQWYTAFSEGRESVKDKPAMEDLQIKKLIKMWRKCKPLRGQTVDSVRMIASELNLYHTTVRKILGRTTKHC
jgi:hypothetical protein